MFFHPFALSVIHFIINLLVDFSQSLDAAEELGQESPDDSGSYWGVRQWNLVSIYSGTGACSVVAFIRTPVQNSIKTLLWYHRVHQQKRPVNLDQTMVVSMSSIANPYAL